MLLNNFDSSKQRKRLFLLSITLLLVFLLSYVSQRLYGSYVHDHWQSISLEQDNQLALQLRMKLEAYQQHSFEVVRTVGRSEQVSALLRSSASVSELACFEALQKYSSSDISMELYDARKRLLSWSGNRNPAVDTAQFLSDETSYILQGPIYTYLMLISPVLQNNMLVGYVVGKRLFDVNYPINNRFVNNKAFSGTFTEELPVTPEFDFSSDAQANPDGRILSIPLPNMHSRQIGFAYVSRSIESSYVEETIERIVLAERIIEVVLLLLLFIATSRIVKEKFSSVWYRLFLIAGIWLLRYVLIWTNLPSHIAGGRIFDPAYFASVFGFGLAQSVGDMLLTSICLLCSIVILTPPLFKRRDKTTVERSHDFWKKAISLFLMFVVAVLFCLMMRGYSATIQSAVFDSILKYNDPTNIIPSFELSCMLVSLLLVGCSLVLASLGIIAFSFSFLRTSFGYNSFSVWLIITGVLSLVSFLFGTLQPHPLMSQFERLVYVVGLILLTFLFFRKAELFSPADFKNVTFIAGYAILLLVPQLDTKVHELDRLHTELAAQGIVRPQDTWMRVILNQALDEMSGKNVTELLSDGDVDAKNGLAFTQWAKSILSRQGFNCSVTYVDLYGNTVSDFHIGIPPDVSFGHVGEDIALTRSVSSEERLQSGSRARWHTGYAPIISSDSMLIGGIRIDVVSIKQSKLHNSDADVLRNSQGQEIGAHYPDIIFSEYVDGHMNFTTYERFPLTQELPAMVDSAHADGIWVEQIIESKKYESYFLADRREASSEAWVSLSFEAPGLGWHLYSFMRYVLLFLFLGLCVVLLRGIVRYIQGRPFRLLFKAKLFAAFMIVSLLPLVILVYYNRQYAIERIEDSIIKKLEESTLTIEAELQKQSGITVPYALVRLTDSECENIAKDMGIDFHVFSGPVFQASSKPELFTAELVDEHLTADAYANIILKKKSFYSESQSIGKYPYIIGYRPLLADDGSVIGVVAVPSLFQQAVLDEESAKNNIFLFGTYIVAMLCAVIIGSFFANQIALPIRRLKIAAGKIAAGDLDIQLTPERKDELGDLEQAFMNMSKDLKKAQEQALKAQRELAWKEMAKQVAHEIKNPLTPMKLSIQHLRQAYKDGVGNFGSLLDQISKTVLEQIDALSRIASEFSHYGRMPDRKIERCNLHEILREAVLLFKQHSQVEFVFEGSSVPVFLYADREELRRAFVNVIRNAVQAMNENGKIVCSVVHKDDLVSIYMKDNGPGIEPEIQKRLFEPNFSTKTDGMGLGLSIVKKIIEDLDGTIEITSRIGEGTIVIIMLPIAD